MIPFLWFKNSQPYVSEDKEPNMRNKLSRGKFNAAFMLHCMAAISVSEIRV
ncbi:DUF6471 domain-containing protein [Pseudooctadecabacter sp.]|uniref:DUF6471 domain-containing protein n=1 Tax=Pseudooctadecabacter sp. TaxID=1966338 RepID=UPI0025E91AD3|nr:DUF6471 domain-containing protein [Pseudooctadecabacter sp.]